VQILTDYRQFYDDLFDDQPPVFQRMAFTRGGLSKRRQFRLFAALGLLTPPHGTTGQLRCRLRASVRTLGLPEPVLADFACVVYQDEYAHRGRGKHLLPLPRAATVHPQALASMFVGQPKPPVAYRYVRLGRWCFWLKQVGQKTGWRSNTRDRETLLTRYRTRRPNPIPRVLWAIDFIPSAWGLLALDFNTAPDLTTLGEVGALSRAQVKTELKHCARESPAHLAQF
jgi:hypothetical protein